MDRVTEEDRRIRLLVAESFRRTYGTPTMTDAEFDTLVQAFLDDQKPEGRGVMTTRRYRWYDMPGVLALVIVGGMVGVLCLVATIWGLW